MAQNLTQFYLEPEEQAALLGELAAGGTAPLSADETEAVRGGLGSLPVGPGPLPNAEAAMAGTAAPMAAPPEPEDAATFAARQPKAPEPAQPAAPKPVETPKAPVIAQTKGTESKVVRTGPEWYDYVAPPKIDGIAPALLQFGSGLVGAAFAPKGRSAVPVIGGMVDALGTLSNAPQANYQNRLNAAKTQADMHTKLSSGSGDQLGWANHLLQREKFDFAKMNAEQKAAYERGMNTLGSAETKMWQQAAISAGWMKPQEALQLTGNQLKIGRVQAGQMAAQGRGLENQMTMAGVRKTDAHEMKDRDLAEYYEKSAHESEKQLGKEDRERQADLARSSMPGFVWESGYAPDASTVNAARRVNASRVGATRAAYELARLQEQVSLVAQGGKQLYEVFGSDENQKRILARMRALQNRLGADLRNIYHQGVPQQFEIALNETVNPRADSIMAFFRGPYAWRELGDEANKAGLDELYNGYNLLQIEEVNPAIAEKPAYQKDSQQRVNEAGAVLDEPSEVVKPAVGMGKKAAGAAQRAVGEVAEAAAPAARTIKIQIMNPATKVWEAATEVTMDEYKAIMHKLAEKKLGPGYVRKAQE